MVYEYHDEVVNKNEVKDFYKPTSFVGYILDDGTIYRAKNHNIESISTFFFMALSNLIRKYSDKDIILDVESNDPIAQLLINYFKRASYDELIALNEFINEYNLSLSDILVGYFRCHLVTRLNKRISTASNDFEPFHNYILMGFTIEKLDKMLYHNKKFKFVDDRTMSNDFYLDEMKKLVSETKESERKMFFR